MVKLDLPNKSLNKKRVTMFYCSTEAKQEDVEYLTTE